MSGPVDGLAESPGGLGVSTIVVQEGRTATIGRLGILRVLPTKGRRTIGPWCFVDLMNPDDIHDPPPIEIGPHPHIGLATVTWLFGGSALHSDSLGTEQLIRPGQLNLMTAGHGIAHAELGVDQASGLGSSGIMGVQMWLAQPEATRHGASRFEHLDALPATELDGGMVTVLVGSFGDASSPARVDHPTVGAELSVRRTLTMPTEPTFEYAIVPIDRPVKVEDAIVELGSLAYVPPGYERLTLETRGDQARLLLLGGEPLGVPVKMWWNFVARDLDEITDAWRAWHDHDDERFGPVRSSLDRVEAPVPPWLTAPDR